MQTTNSFNRTIGLSTATSLVIGSIIGSGIFMRPAEMAGLLGSPVIIFIVWIVAGFFTLFNVMVYAELGAMLPATGGQYVFMQHMYGDFWAYLFGWAEFIVINTAGTAGIAFIFSEYATYFISLPRFIPETEQSVVLHLPMIGNIFPLENFGVKMLTILLLGLLTFINYRSTRIGGAMQVFFTFAKILAIALLVGGLFFSGSGSFKNFITDSAILKPAGFALMAAIVAAINGALQAYDGWGNMIYVAGEIDKPGKNIPRSLILGLFICIAVYLLVTAAMMYILPVNIMAGSSLVASDAAEVAFGTIGGGIIAMLICLSVLGTTNGSVLTSPRITFSMAHEGNFFQFAGHVHPKFKTPANALWLHFAVMIIMVLSGSFYILADMYIFILWVFNLMIIYGLFILRRKMPGVTRPYKVWGYPYIPILVILFNAFYLVMTLYNDINNYVAGKTHIINSVFGLALTAAGIPLYFYFKMRYKQKDGKLQ